MADEDDYYLRFDGQNQKDGSGAWSECAKPNISKRLYNMPLVIQRTAATTFTISQRTVDSDGNDSFKYHDRRVGDDITNPLPSFVTQRINKVLFFRNRLALLSAENVVLSRPGTLGNPDFFGESALTVSASDPIDISSASMFPSDLFDGVASLSRCREMCLERLTCVAFTFWSGSHPTMGRNTCQLSSRALIEPYMHAKNVLGKRGTAV